MVCTKHREIDWRPAPLHRGDRPGFVILRVAFNQLTIETLNSAEELTADVHQAGTANVPVGVFCALAKTLRYHVANESNSASQLAASAWIER
jgi:hypothetical protein